MCDPWVRKIPWRRKMTILAWRIPWTRSLRGYIPLHSCGVTRIRHDLATKPPPRVVAIGATVRSAGWEVA